MEEKCEKKKAEPSRRKRARKPKGRTWIVIYVCARARSLLILFIVQIINLSFGILDFTRVNLGIVEIS
jgi:hypothetical protein